MIDQTNAMLSRASALRAQGRGEEALALYRRIVSEAPSHGLALYSLAAVLGDEGAFQEAADVAERALDVGFDRAETWLVRARALAGLGRFEPARACFEAVLTRRPDMLAARYELSQLVWMCTADRDGALAPFDQALRSNPADPALLFARAKALEYMGEIEAAQNAMATLANSRPQDLPPQLAAAYLSAAAGHADLAMAFVERALERAPDDMDALTAHASACLAAGRPDAAAQSAQRVHQARPMDQNAIALMATAWRASGDPRWKALFDYEQFVHARKIATPGGWSDLPGYLADLARELKAAHAFHTHPFGQSVRHGSQRQDVLKLETPAISVFREAIEPVVRGILEELGTGADPVRRRNTGRWSIKGAWSVRLRPGGFHHDHIHSDGWLSSAFYVEVPPCVNGPGQQGWLRFGHPGIPVAPPLEAGRVIQPEPGLLVLFPSYMWHGTIPFSGDAARMTVAMDIVPA
ncbi:MAG: putative 2OG-Fe(II) oxygenase [Alphaproteobacteria bacterium]|nr:putative 2OG-Fe(II) oxygenase [Alphaproteobacteria bacterium]